MPSSPDSSQGFPASELLMSENLGLIGNTIGSYQIQRKRRCFDPYALYFEAIDTDHRETYWMIAYPSEILSVPGVFASIESEIQDLYRLKHDFLMHPTEVIHDSKEQYLFLVFPAFTRSIPLKELDGKLRPVQIRKLFYFLANLLEATHDHGIFGSLDPRQIYVRRQGDDIDIRWYRTPMKYHHLLPKNLETTDENEWWSYQSPETVKGQPATPRSDFFSLGTILFESLTGKRAFFHQVADQVQQMIVSGSSKHLERVKLTPEQLEFLQDLHQCDPALRLTSTRVFQEKIRDMFQDVSKYPEVYPQTSEHPALYVKESQPQLSGASAGSIPEQHTNTSMEWRETSSRSPQSISSIPDQEQHSVVSTDQNQDISFVTVSPGSQGMGIPSCEEETADSMGGKQGISAFPVAVVHGEENKTKELVSEAVPVVSSQHSEEEPHATAIVYSHHVMNLKKIHPVVVKIETSSSAQRSSETTELQSPSSSSPYIRIVPVFPGCLVSPQEVIVDVRTSRIEAHFWVVPLASVDIFQAACIQLWHGGVPKDEIPVPSKIYSQIPTWIAAFASILSFVAGFAFDLYGPQTQAAFKADASLISHMFHQSITVFAGYGFWFGFFFLFVAGISYYLRRPQSTDPIRYVLSQTIPSAQNF